MQHSVFFIVCSPYFCYLYWECPGSNRFWGTLMYSKPKFYFFLSYGGGGGGGTWGSKSSTSPYHVLLPPDSHPSLSPPFTVFRLIKRIRNPGLASSKLKNCVEKWTTPHSPVRSDIPLKQVCTMTQNLQQFWKRSRTERAPFKVFHEGIFRCHIEKFWGRFAFFAGDFRQLQLTRLWSISGHVSCVMLSHDLWLNRIEGISNFLIYQVTRWIICEVCKKIFKDFQIHRK